MKSHVALFFYTSDLGLLSPKEHGRFLSTLADLRSPSLEIILSKRHCGMGQYISSHVLERPSHNSKGDLITGQEIVNVPMEGVSPLKVTLHPRDC